MIHFYTNTTIFQGCRARAPELGILSGARSQIKNQKHLELSLKFRTETGATAIWEVALDSLRKY